MKVGILAGGRGARLGDAEGVPKPLVEIGGRPLLWHIMMHYVHHGFHDFVIALGHGGNAIRRYFADPAPDWTVTLVDTGEHTMTGGRLNRLRPYLGAAPFMLTYSDGVSDVDLRRLEVFHRRHGRRATVTAVSPPPRFGRLTLDGDRVVDFTEKPPGSDGWINGAFFVLDPSAFDYIDGDVTVWEKGPLERLAREGELMAYRHTGFWACLDTPADLARLRELWNRGERPWVTWETGACASS
jgi:glucose-1-phosphate cytidylyltransferase